MDQHGVFFFFGAGYCASRVVPHLQQYGFTMRGTTQHDERVALLRGGGVEPHMFSSGLPLADPEHALHEVSHILISIPPDQEGDPVLRHHAEHLAALGEQLQWVGYLSTTGVYGDHGGEWVDETTPVAPGNDRLKRRVEAEQGWLELWRAFGLPVHIFRLAGIYGPASGRSPVDKLLTGDAKRVYKEGQFFSRIHVEDVAAVLAASMEHPHPGAVYNVCDDEPAPSHEVIEYAAGLLGMEPPPMLPYTEAGLSDMGREFYESNRRVKNQKIKDELGVRLIYPTYRRGIEQIVRLKKG